MQLYHRPLLINLLIPIAIFRDVCCFCLSVRGFPRASAAREISQKRSAANTTRMISLEHPLGWDFANISAKGSGKTLPHCEQRNTGLFSMRSLKIFPDLQRGQRIHGFVSSLICITFDSMCLLEKNSCSFFTARFRSPGGDNRRLAGNSSLPAGISNSSPVSRSPRWPPDQL